MPTTREQIVKALLAEMRHKLETATPQTRQESDAAILFLSQTLLTFTAEPAIPTFF